MNYDGSVNGGARGSRRPSTLLIHINTRPTDHIISEGMISAILTLTRVVEIILALSLMGIHMMKSSFKMVCVDPGYPRGCYLVWIPASMVQ